MTKCEIFKNCGTKPMTIALGPHTASMSVESYTVTDRGFIATLESRSQIGRDLLNYLFDKLDPKYLPWMTVEGKSFSFEIVTVELRKTGVQILLEVDDDE